MRYGKLAAGRRRKYKFNIQTSKKLTEIRTARSPADSERALVASAVAARIGSIGVGPSIRTDDGQVLDLGEVDGERVLGVLEEDGAGGANLADELAVVALDVDVLVDELALVVVVLGVVVEVDRGEALVLAQPVSKPTPLTVSGSVFNKARGCAAYL